VVPETSATLGYPGEEALPLNGNHSTIVKYQSDTDNNYKVVSENISLLLKEATNKRTRMNRNQVPHLTGTPIEGEVPFLQLSTK
jgi:hypothetical protein